LAKMYAEERRKKIYELLQSDQRVSVKKLSELLAVTEATLRTDLNAMEEEGLLTRTHGGAVITGEIKPEFNYSEREKSNRELKKRLAEQAAELVQNGDCILIDASSTVLELARILKNKHIRLIVVTNGINAAMELKENPEITVILLGGLLRMGSVAVEGHLGVSVLENININKMFTSANGFTIAEGLTDFNVYEVELKKAMVQSAAQVIALLDSSKLGKSSLAAFCETSDIDMLITNQTAPPAFIKELGKEPIKLVLA
jgi:DeoR/GlpR family transcriptional regulator of sugar metabolism